MDKSKLSNKDELKLLKYLTMGLNLKQAGEKMGISKYRTYKLSKNIKTVLNAKNMPNAAYIAYKSGIIK